MKILHVSNHHVARCGVAEFGRQFSAAVRAAGHDCVDWDGDYPAIYEKPYLPADVHEYDWVHFNWHPATINHYRPQHVEGLRRVSVYFHDLPPWSSCALLDYAQVIIGQEPCLEAGVGIILPPPLLPPRPAVPLAAQPRVGRTGIGVAGDDQLRQICEEEGWEYSCSSLDWVSNEQELDRLASCWVNVVWYDYHRARSSAASIAASAGRPLVLSTSTRFLHLTEAYETEVYVTQLGGLRTRLRQVIDEVLAGTARRPNRMIAELQWDRMIQPTIQAWEQRKSGMGMTTSDTDAVDRRRMPIYHTQCRACGADLIQAFTLGNLHLSGFPLPDPAGGSPTARWPRIPLDVTACSGCQLVQLAHTTPFQWMYGQTHYWYRSGINETMRAELRDVADSGAAAIQAHAEMSACVVDVGANDGTLLRRYPPHWTRIAVEPSASLHEELRQHCDVLIPEAFPSPRLEAYEGQVDILTAVAMLYDLEHPADFFTAVAKLLSPTGVCIVQFQDLLQQLERNAFDVICHEHLEYYTLWSLKPLIEAAGLRIVDVEARAINGGSLRITIGLGAGAYSPRVWDWLTRETMAGLTNTQTLLTRLHHHYDAILVARRQIRGIFEQVKDFGGEIDLFGASTKANTLLQVFDLDSSWIRQAIERSPEKIGRCVGQTGIPIVSEEVGRQDPAVLSLVGIWQFRDGLVAREAEYLQRGGKLLFPLPRVEMVGGAGLTDVWGDGEGVA